MKQIILTLFLFLTINILKSQDLTSCQEDNRHSVMQKRNVILDYQTKFDSVKIVLNDISPPLQWWNPFIIAGKRGNEILKKENPNHSKTHGKEYKNQRLVEIINLSQKELIFTNPDRQLMLGLQAINKQGEWEDVEEFFIGICGRSFKSSYNDTIKPKQEWLTFVEIYKGNMKTKYRLKLLINRGNKYYFSNEIEGTIDECRFIEMPGVLWRKK